MSQPSDTIQRLAETSQWFHPYLVHETNMGNIQVSHTNISSLQLHRLGSEANISQVYKALRSLFPNAGPRYWSARCWSVVYWQLVYINLACVHRLRLPIKSNSIVQHAKAASVYGYHIDPSIEDIHHDTLSEEKLVTVSGNDLRDCLELLFEQCLQTFQFSHKKAFRLVAASVVNALTTLFRKLNTNSLTDLHDITQEWLSGMNLLGEANLKINSNQALTLRKACCMHYLVESNNCCVDCPRYREKRSRGI